MFKLAAARDSERPPTRSRSLRLGLTRIGHGSVGMIISAGPGPGLTGCQWVRVTSLSHESGAAAWLAAGTRIIMIMLNAAARGRHHAQRRGPSH